MGIGELLLITWLGCYAYAGRVRTPSHAGSKTPISPRIAIVFLLAAALTLVFSGQRAGGWLGTQWLPDDARFRLPGGFACLVGYGVAIAGRRAKRIRLAHLGLVLSMLGIAVVMGEVRGILATALVAMASIVSIQLEARQLAATGH